MNASRGVLGDLSTHKDEAPELKRLSGSFNLVDWHLQRHCHLVLWVMAAELRGSSTRTSHYFDHFGVCVLFCCMCVYSVCFSGSVMISHHHLTAHLLVCLSASWKHLYYFVLLLHCLGNDQFCTFTHTYVLNHWYKHTNAHTHTHTHTQPWPSEGWTPNPSPWNLAPWADWNNRCDNVTVPEILPWRWYKYKYCHLSLMASPALCWLSHPVFLCQGWAGVQIPSTGLCSSLEVSRCWSYFIIRINCFDSSSASNTITFERIYETVCILSCKQSEYSYCQQVLTRQLL